MTTLSEKPSGSRASPRLVYAAAWVVLGCAYVALFVASGMPLSAGLRGTLAAIIPNALLGRWSLALARRSPSAASARGKHLGRLALAAAGVAALATAGWLGLASLDRALFPPAMRPPSGTIVAWQLFVNTLLHLTLAGIGYAWQAAETVREAQDHAARADVLRARAELQLLRSQLNPHFVLNMLHAMLGLVRRDPALAERALERLGDLLKFGQWVHQSGADFVPLSREWDFVKSYLELERIRLGERLRVSLEADEEALHSSVPPFALQPLVENAIVHAVAPRASGGRIAVSARRSDGWLCLSVQDDGPGTSEEAIAASPRMGLRLLQERVAALYAGRARLAYESPSGGGLRVRLELPEAIPPEVA